jgi:hypothetical protein
MPTVPTEKPPGAESRMGRCDVFPNGFGRPWPPSSTWAGLRFWVHHLVAGADPARPSPSQGLVERSASVHRGPPTVQRRLGSCRSMGRTPHRWQRTSTVQPSTSQEHPEVIAPTGGYGIQSRGRKRDVQGEIVVLTPTRGHEPTLRKDKRCLARAQWFRRSACD